MKSHQCLNCPDRPQFVKLAAFRQHRYEWHCKKCTYKCMIGGSQKEITITRIDDVLTCPKCNKSWKKRLQLKYHFDTSDCLAKYFQDQSSHAITTETPDDDSGNDEHNLSAESGQDWSNNEQEQVSPSVFRSVPSVPQIPSATIPIKAVNTLHTYDHAILQACNATQLSHAHKSQLLNFVQAMNLTPISLTNNKNGERNALIHEDLVTEVCSTSYNIVSPVARKRMKLDLSSQQTDSDLSTILSTSPYSEKCADQTYVEVDSQTVRFLNEDWITKPQMRFACASMLSGMILMSNNKALLVNCIEVYGRTKSVDAHRERFNLKKGIPPVNSIPPHDCRYQNIWARTITDIDGTKLVIGTKTFNALVTSSLRLDAAIEPEVGPSTLNLLLHDETQGKQTRMFIHMASFRSATDLAKKSDVSSVYEHNLLYQLRQVRSKFHQASTYSLCRASSTLTNDHMCQPYTIFTLADNDNGHDYSDGRMISLLFREIACSVLRSSQESRASLQRSFVLELQKHCNLDRTIRDKLGSILDLYGNNEADIPIIGNVTLNNILQTLSHKLATHINQANASQINVIKHRFQNHVEL